MNTYNNMDKSPFVHFFTTPGYEPSSFSATVSVHFAIYTNSNIIIVLLLFHYIIIYDCHYYIINKYTIFYIIANNTITSVLHFAIKHEY